MIRKTTSIPLALACLYLITFNFNLLAQNIGTVSSAVWISDCNQNNFFNTSGIVPNEIGPASNSFNGANLGVHTQHSGTLVLRGAEVRTFQTTPVANICSARLWYRVYLSTGIPGSFNSIDLPFFNDCEMPAGSYPSGGNCSEGDQKWQRIIPDGVSLPFAPINLTALAAGTYTLELYYEITGSSTSATLCDETILLNNGGSNFKASFSIQAPVLSSNNPTTCNGTEGSITISGLSPGATYSVTYTDDGIPAGPVDLAANASGQILLGSLNAGIYSNFELLINGCATNLFTGIILSNPVFTPTFTKIQAFCAGTVPPPLPAVSNNGISGTWSPSVINNQASGFYTFTPAAGQCGLPVMMSITVTPNTVPSFSFGTSWSVCAGGVVPVLPAISNNGISGVWSPSNVDNQNSGVYTFTPNSGPCAIPTTLTVNISPNIAPNFDFGASLTICEGDAVPSLPVLSNNGITGTWNPAIVDNLNSAVYTFTPAAGQCATPASFTLTVMPKLVPLFSFGTGMSICENGTAPALPNTSDNGVTGAWNPAVVDNQASATYTFTPANGQCAVPASFTVTVTPNITPVFDFGTSIVICANGIVPVLTNISSNGISGSWSPAVVDNQASNIYTFTPDPGSCVLPATFTVTVTPNVIPIFGFGTSQTICAGSSVPALPLTSNNGITGTWSPAVVDAQTSGIYTFTPTDGVCAIPATFTLTVEQNITPQFAFGASLTICAGGSVPVLPALSDNGITGTWKPAIINNQSGATYTFTPSTGQCATTTSFDLVVTPNVIPQFAFGTSLSICEGGTVPALPAISDNGIAGTWSPAVVSNTASDAYTFTPDNGICALPVVFNVSVAPNIVPSFSFGTALAICAGGGVPTLPLLSSNAINGVWNPAVVDNQASGVYTFTPDAGLCALPTSFTVTITNNTIPTFTFGSTLSICSGAAVPVLPTVSNNGVAGTWDPAIVSNQASGIYTFTPTAGTCALATSFNVTVEQNLLPQFDFGTSLSICNNGIVPVLPATSINGITGSWSPTLVDNQTSAVYTFTPDAGQCALQTQLNVQVNPIVTPSFSFGNSMTICSGDEAPLLPPASTNNITGTWLPAIIDNQASAVYTFTPAAGQCAVTVIFTMTVTPSVIPVFNLADTITICAGASAPVLPTTSVNGLTGTWNPATVNNQATTDYTFTPSGTPDQCLRTVKITVVVKPILTPQFSFGETLTLCRGGAAPALSTTSGNGIKGSWSPAAIDNQASGAYTFTADPGQCAVASFKLNVTVNPVPSVDESADIIVNDGDIIPSNILNGTPAGAGFNWYNSTPSIGLAASGTGNVPSFNASNTGNDAVSATITITPLLNGCAGEDKSYLITVKPLDKDIFVPNVFSPNGDGKNDILFVYGNYIEQVELRIFNQWGQQIELLNSTSRGWNGTYKGKPQPVGVYVYTLKAVLKGGRDVKMKGSITLLR